MGFLQVTVLILLALCVISTTLQISVSAANAASNNADSDSDSDVDNTTYYGAHGFAKNPDDLVAKKPFDSITEKKNQGRFQRGFAYKQHVPNYRNQSFECRRRNGRVSYRSLPLCYYVSAATTMLL